MLKLTTITIALIHFILGMVFVIILPNSIVTQISPTKVVAIGSKWISLIWIIVPLLISCTLLIKKDKQLDKQKDFYKGRDIIAVVMTYAWVIVGWVLFAIANNTAIIGHVITIPVKSLAILSFSLVWSIFVYRLLSFDFKSIIARNVLIWLFYILSAIAFALGCFGIMFKDNLVVLIFDAVLVVVSATLIPTLPKHFAKKFEKLALEQQAKKDNEEKYSVKTGKRPQNNNRQKQISKVRAANPKNVNFKIKK